jgi:hypothetical protein
MFALVMTSVVELTVVVVTQSHARAGRPGVSQLGRSHVQLLHHNRVLLALSCQQLVGRQVATRRDGDGTFYHVGPASAHPHLHQPPAVCSGKHYGHLARIGKC